MITSDVQPPWPSTILHVEDEVVTQQAFARALNGSGFEVVFASSVGEAVAKAQDGPVSLVLMDVLLDGEGANGIEAARLIRKSHPHTPIIFVSAYVQDPSFREQIRNAGLDAVAFFDKSALASATPIIKIIEETIAASKGAHPIESSTELVEPPYKIEEKNEATEVEDLAPVLAPYHPQIYQLDHIDLALYAHLQAHPELLKTLNWRVLEELIADIVKTFGYTVELTRPTKDGGIDVIALGKPEPWGMHRYLIQAKQTGRRIGVEPVRELIFLHNDLRATRSCLATTSTFTRGAWDLSSKYQWQLELRDYDGLKEWVQKAARLKRRV